MAASVTYEFLGSLPQGSFAEFARHRAARLSLEHRMIAQDDSRAVVQVRGPEALIEAFEMALSLGPQACMVRDVRRLDPYVETPE